jgi:sporulation protein YlmC with PRC-barrel domain
MRLTKRELINLPVYTQSNQHLGRVSDFEVDSATHVIVKYRVKSGSLIKEFLQKELIIAKEQVISMSAEKMVVEDTLLAEEEMKKLPVSSTVPVR